jgi:hypothetical protein
MSIKSNQRKHAIKRAKQRYNLNLTPDQIRFMVAQIQAGKSKFVRSISNRRTLHIVKSGGLGGELLWALYDNTRKNIATFYPPKGQK